MPVVLEDAAPEVSLEDGDCDDDLIIPLTKPRPPRLRIPRVSHLPACDLSQAPCCTMPACT